MLMGLVASPESLESDSDLLALVLRFAARGLSARARVCFSAAASRGQAVAGPHIAERVQRLQRQVWSRAADSSTSRLVLACLIQGNTPNGTWGPAWIHRGIGGSEQAAIYLAAALQRSGLQVEVYGAQRCDPKLGARARKAAACMRAREDLCRVLDVLYRVA